MERGGGVTLRINITAAAADTDKPQTGRNDVRLKHTPEKVSQIITDKVATPTIKTDSKDEKSSNYLMTSIEVSVKQRYGEINLIFFLSIF